MKHDHEFIAQPSGTLMVDRFEFQSPLGIIGRVVDRAFLGAYMRRFLLRRNDVLKKIAESERWRRYVPA
ncbi:MAG TPA: hypothetical protein VL992_06265 [Tepidisphaeraceae bacterium]|nr:hypothetical protein [Tepidisphaeraceae bacterium]